MSQSHTNGSVASILLKHPQLDTCVRFDWSADRFDHAIDHNEQSLVTVIEGQDAAWPASPPIQQLSVESIDDRDVALGVGCAGTSHWSLSVEPVDDGFRFDWACRSKETPKFLGTTYRLSAGFDCFAEAGANVESKSGTHVVMPNAELAQGDTIRWSYLVRLT